MWTRIDTLLKQRGIGHYSLVKDMIRTGKVWDERGNLIKSTSKKLSPFDVVIVDRKPVHPIPLLSLYHKPVGMISTVGDPIGRSNLSKIVSHNAISKDIHPVGRLDSDTSGLLLFSTSGALTNILLQPKSCIEREYEAIVTGLINIDEAKFLLKMGVQTADGIYTANLMSCKHVPFDAHFVQSFKTAKDCDIVIKPILKMSELKEPSFSKIRLSVTEGKHRMVRRILHNIGHSVVELKRVSFGMAELGDLEIGNLKEACFETQKWGWNLLNNK